MVASTFHHKVLSLGDRVYGLQNKNLFAVCSTCLPSKRMISGPKRFFLAAQNSTSCAAAPQRFVSLTTYIPLAHTHSLNQGGMLVVIALFAVSVAGGPFIDLSHDLGMMQR